MASEEPTIAVHHPQDLTLPLRRGPIRFAVVLNNGLTSHSWKVFTHGGDAYVVCRESMKEIKVSLHDSGRQHIAFTKGSGHEITPGSRFWNRWWQPSSGQCPPVPSVKLLFPSWGTTLRIDAVRPKWKNTQLLIEGDDELVTSVCLFVREEDQNLRQTRLPSLTLGVLPLRTGKELHVISCREEPRNLKKVAEAGIQFMNHKMPIAVDMVGEVMTALFVGDDPVGCPYLLPLLVDAKMRITADRTGAIAYDMCMTVLVDAGWYTDPEPWDALDTELKDAWKIIGRDWLRRLPSGSKLAELIEKGSVEIE